MNSVLRILALTLLCMVSVGYAADVTITETGPSSSINPHVYGTMNQGTYTIDSQENGVFFYEDSAALAVLNRMAIGNQRILGGTNTWANSIYNKGHGYKTHCGGLLVSEIVGDCNKDEDEPYNFHYQHLDLVNALSNPGAANMIYVTNYLQPVAELQSIIPYWQSQGINVFAVELGNEYHLGAFRTAFPTAADYADWAAARAAAVKAIDPTIKTGVMLPKPYLVSGNSFYESWMSELSSRYQAETLDIDFVVCHIYQQVADCYEGASCEQGRACVVDRLPWTDDPSRLYIDTRYQMMKTWYYDWLPPYFPGCEIYFTEWGLKKRELGHGNTPIQGWHVVRELMEFHRANHEYNGIVGCANFTKFVQPNTAAGMSIIQPYTIPGYGVQSPNLQGSTTFIGSIEAECFALFKPVQTGYYLETSQSKPSGMDPYIRVELLQATGGTKYLFYTNRTDNSYTVEVSGGTAGDNLTIYGDWTDQGGMTQCITSGWTLPTLTTYTNDNVMRPRSVGRITVGAGGGDTTPPAAPTNLVATAGDGQVSLDWDDNTEGDLAGYNVYRSTTTGSGYSKINGSLVATSNYTDTSVTNTTTYYYVVTAVDTSTNESGYSNEDFAMPTGSGGGTEYFNPTDDSFVVAGNPTANKGSAVVLDVRDDPADNWDKWSYLKFSVTGISGSVTTAKLQLYSEDVNQTVYCKEVSDNSWTEGTIIWNNKPSPGATVDSVAVSSSSWTEFDVTSAVSGNGTFSFCMQGSANVAQGFTSKEGGANKPLLEVTYGGGGGDTTPPAAPTGLVATAGDGQVSLDWNDNTESDLDGYNVYRSTLSGSGYAKINGSLVSASAYTDSTVSNNTTFYYVVTAVDTSTNESGYSNEDSAYPQDTTPPAAPTNLGVTAGDGQMSLNWSDNGEGDLDGYNVYRSTTTGSGYSKINGSLVQTSDYVDNTTSNNTTYYYVVTAVDTSSNESGYSNEDSDCYDTIAPSNPTGLVATAGDGQVSLDWNDNTESDLDGYNVYRSTTSGSGYSKINGSLVSASAYTDNTVSNGTTYYYVVTAVDTSSNESGYSNEDSAVPAGGGNLQFNPTDDSYVKEKKPTTNYGSAVELRVRGAGSGREIQSYLKFTVSGVTGTVTTALLKIRSEVAIDDTTAKTVSDTSWTEGSIVWNNRPAMVSTLDAKTSISSDTWYSFDVTSHITGNGTFSLGLTSTQNTSSLDWSSKESAYDPVLDVTW